jgi:chloramphenicol O-acetyltransferase type B
MKLLKRVIYDLIRFALILRGYKIGRNFKIGRNVNIEKRGFKCGHHVYIGQWSYIGPNTEIGNYTMISDNVNIIGHDHVFDIAGSPICFNGRPVYEPVTFIGNDVLVGHAVTILRGIKIGNGAIVGANSVVTKDVEDYSIVVGNPARHIKFRFNETMDREKHEKAINA